MPAWFWWLAAPAVALAMASLRGERRRARWIRERLAQAPDGSLPPATVIVPVKGPDPGMRENLAALASQDYPDYELIVTAREALDIPAGVLPSGAKVALGRADDPATGDKILNLLAGVKAARKHSEVLAFADADGRVERGWLRAIAAPLADPGVGASTGYRWHVPEPAGFWPLMRSVWDAVVAGSLGPRPCRFAWGGSMAIRKETFFAARVPDFWAGQVSDDYALSAAVLRSGLRIAFAPGAMAATPGRPSARELFSWTRRQLMLTRFHDPRLWWTALGAHVIYCAGMAAGAAALALGYPAGAAALVLQLAPGIAKGRRRAQLARLALPAYDGWYRRYGWAHGVLVPAATWLWLIALGASAMGHTIAWRGRTYSLRR